MVKLVIVFSNFYVGHFLRSENWVYWLFRADSGFGRDQRPFFRLKVFLSTWRRQLVYQVVVKLHQSILTCWWLLMLLFCPVGQMLECFRFVHNWFIYFHNFPFICEHMFNIPIYLRSTSQWISTLASEHWLIVKNFYFRLRCFLLEYSCNTFRVLELVQVEGLSDR